MMKALEKLIASRTNATVGNHAVMFCDIPNNGAALHILHIMPGTSRALNDYRRYFVDELGYTLVNED